MSIHDPPHQFANANPEARCLKRQKTILRRRETDRLAWFLHAANVHHIRGVCQ